MPVSEQIIIASFYVFTPLADYREMRRSLMALCRENHMRGTIILAAEGVNATVAGVRPAVENLMQYFHRDDRFRALEYKESVADDYPFYRMKIKLKREIVSLGIPGVDPVSLTGKRVAAGQWNDLISDPDVVVIDVRNRYESDIGTFKNAVSPDTGSFREFPDYVYNNLDPGRHRKVAMFCTGGIRCEKASSYLLQQGFNEVYQLQGGILRYLEQCEPGKSQWYGECFVFDGRVAVDENLDKGEYEQCFSCRAPVSLQDRLSPRYQEGVTCPVCHDSLTVERRASLEERQRQVKLAEKSNRQHIGIPQTTPRDHGHS